MGAQLVAVAIGTAIGATAMHFVHAQPPATKAVRLLHADLTGVSGKEVMMTIVDAQPGAGFPPHIHHGDEFVYVIEGSYERFVEQLHTVAKAGEGFHIEREKVHAERSAALCLRSCSLSISSIRASHSLSG